MSVCEGMWVWVWVGGWVGVSVGEIGGSQGGTSWAGCGNKQSSRLAVIVFVVLVAPHHAEIPFNSFEVVSLSSSHLFFVPLTCLTAFVVVERCIPLVRESAVS